ncbi:zinc finger protein 419-like [Oppia nitens]|uniref:zinc finger protein 419-like n=1 Tax=Oppia nitens TaxID=1686743 RepID=UPI0023DC89CE|nr:zinc finger protein 419-like [Oppia nitens]
MKITDNSDCYDNNNNTSMDNNKQFKCFWPKCRYLKQHKRTNHLNIKPFKCDVDNCGKQFAIKSQLLRHQRKHTGIKPFKCNVNECNKCFLTLRQHKRTNHLNIKPFKCDVDNCDKQFAFISELLKHHRKHSGIKPFKSRNRVLLLLSTRVSLLLMML